MTTVREFTQMLLDLPADQQDLPFVTCLGWSAECDFETPRALYAQPEISNTSRNAAGRTELRLTGNLEHVRPTGD